MLPVTDVEVYTSDKIVEFNECIKLIASLKAEGKTVGLCHGGFDLLHPGHIKHFESAKKLCDVLIVSITSDNFVSGRKGTGRPIFTEQLRAYNVATISFVDYVVITNFKLATDILHALKPSYYIKGPDFIHKTTPGITSEREAIKAVGGEMKYTNDPKLGTTEIIEYIKNELDKKSMLLVIDRDGTLIEDAGFLGKNHNWRDEIKFNEPVLHLISHIQTKYRPKKIIVSNQTGIARKFFDHARVDEINGHVGEELSRRSITIDDWQYCPFADLAYVKKHPEYEFNHEYVGENTKRKPNPAMVHDSLKKLGSELKDFSPVIVIGDSSDDEGLAKNIEAKFIDVRGKNYEELVKEFEEKTK